jgi:hypothetical protein
MVMKWHARGFNQGTAQRLPERSYINSLGPPFPKGEEGLIPFFKGGKRLWLHSTFKNPR